MTQPSTLASLLGSLSSEPTRRGREFERLAKWFLENDPIYRSRLKRVWLWNEWPGRWGADAGIDLVAEARDGSLWAIQAKGYAPQVSVTKGDIDTFLSESARAEFGYRLVIASTDRIGATARRTLEGQSIPVGTLMLSHLASSEVAWPTSLAHLRPARPKPKKPRPHQRKACRDVLAGLKDADRGQLVMACGTGKTLTSLFVAEELGARRILFLVPSLSLLSQVAHAWVASSRRPIEFIAVCSDESVIDEDAVVGTTAELAFPATTNAERVGAFLSSRRPGARVIFATYQSSAVVARAQRSGVPAFDLVIADEAHRLAGDVSGDFASVLRAKEIRSNKRLFMTATPRYATGRIIKAARDQDVEIASMDDVEAFGARFHTLSFGKAIEQNLLTDYRVAVIGIDDASYLNWVERGIFVRSDGLKDMDARTLAAHIGLSKAMKKFDIRRAISFHSRVKAARLFAETHDLVRNWLPPSQRASGTVATDYISGSMPAGERSVRLERLRHPSATRALLANARCLTEGIDVPALDGVAFIDPRRSEVDIVQAVGRAIRLDAGKRLGTIVVPVFMGAEANPEDQISTSAFRPVWDVLNALRAHDEVLAAELDSLRRGLPKSSGSGPRLPSKIHVDLPTWVTTEFSRQVRVRLVENTTAGWEEWFGRLVRYCEREGHARVPREVIEDGARLGEWVGRQRQYRASLSADRASRLEALPDWTWDPYEEDWNGWFARLQAFVAREGDARVPYDYLDGQARLGAWVAAQRRARSDLSSSRKARLESLAGWTWAPHSTNWEQGFAHLTGYVERVGTARVPGRHREEDFLLGQWVQVQRRNREGMPKDRRERLEGLAGWTWDHLADQWEDAFKLLSDYAAENGTSRLPDGYRVAGFPLARWAHRQRSSERSLSEERRARLESLPQWSWRPHEDDWEENFRALERFAEEHGHARVPNRKIVDGVPLGTWVLRQRRRRTSMPQDRRERLEALPGWMWDPSREIWERCFSLLEAYTAAHGTARVPPNCVMESVNLGQWVMTQRVSRATMPEERQRRLESLPGWSWDPFADDWNRAFNLLVQYFERVGDLSVPRRHMEDGVGLGRWVQVQRAAKDRMDPSRRARLESLPGWRWTPG